MLSVRSSDRKSKLGHNRGLPRFDPSLITLPRRTITFRIVFSQPTHRFHRRVGELRKKVQSISQHSHGHAKTPPRTDSLVPPGLIRSSRDPPLGPFSLFFVPQFASNQMSFQPRCSLPYSNIQLVPWRIDLQRTPWLNDVDTDLDINFENRKSQGKRRSASTCMHLPPYHDK